MSTLYRNSRIGRSSLFRTAESAGTSGVGGELAPDIFTERNRPELPVHAEAPAVARSRPQAVVGTQSVLELRHPDIVKAIALLWGFPEMNQYFDRIWVADGNAAPIDPDAMSELMLLSRVHQMIVPQTPGRSLASIYGNNKMFEPGSTRSTRDPWRDVPPRR